MPVDVLSVHGNGGHNTVDLGFDISSRQLSGPDRLTRSSSKRVGQARWRAQRQKRTREYSVTPVRAC
jgi:hypothetical protein